MLNAVIRFSLRYRSLVLFLCLAALVYGGYTATQLPIDVFPDLDRPRVVVLTEAPGYAPEDVESLITFPLESALNGASGVEAIRSESGPGLSVITVNFDWGTNIYTARQVVQERLNTVTLPSADIVPQLAPISSIMGQILVVGMTRQAGPHGGVTTPFGPGGRWLAELVWDVGEGRAAIFLWAPQGRGEPKDWTPIIAGDESIVLTSGQLNGVLVLERQAGGSYAAEDARLRGSDERLRPDDFERTTAVTVDGQRYEVRFAPLAERHMELRTIADWVVRQRLVKVPGVAQVVVMGGGRKQYQVLVDPLALAQYKVTLEQVKRALASSNVNVSAAFRFDRDREQPIRFLGRPASGRVIAELERIPIRGPTANIPLHKVARVVEAAQLPRGDASIDGTAGVVLTITKQPHVDTRQLTEDIRRALVGDPESRTPGVADALPADVRLHLDLFALERFINLGVYNVGEALVIGAVLVLIILFLFLLNFRTTFISLTAIPLSLAITVLVFRLIGWLSGMELSINVMTLGGIAVALGELVDDAIVDVENIFRRLRENNARESPRPALTVVYEASVEIRSAIVYGTMMVILVFIPLFALSGIEGRLFTPLGVAYIVSILASLLVSLSVTPVLSYYLLPQARATHRRQESWLLRGLKWAAAALVRLSLAHPGKLLAAGWLLALLALAMLMRLGADFLPPFDEGSVQVNVTLPPGSSLEASNEVCRLVDVRLRELRKSGAILGYFRRTGRAELDEHAEPVSNTEYILTVNPDSGLSREELLEKLRAELRAADLGAGIEVEQPLAHLISHMLSGVQAQVAIKIYGDDLDTLHALAENVKAAIGGIDGVRDVEIESRQQVEEVHIRPRREEMLRYGVESRHVAEFVRTALYGKIVSEIVEGDRRFDLLVTLERERHITSETLKRLMLDVPGESGAAAERSDADGTEESGGKPPGLVPLGALADVHIGLGPNTVGRDHVRRRIAVRCNISGRDLAGAVAEIQARIAQHVRTPQGYFIEYGGQFQSQQQATRVIGLLVVVSVIGMFVVLLMLYPSMRIVLQVLNALPMAFIGGVAALWLTGQTLTVAALVGFISLGGIAARNGILLVSHYFYLMRHEGEGFTKAMVLRGSLERLAPVLMTALTAGFALIPLVVGGHAPGREILYPVATVILGGLTTSTLCEYLLHPGLFYRFSGKHAVRRVQELGD